MQSDNQDPCGHDDDDDGGGGDQSHDQCCFMNACDDHLQSCCRGGGGGGGVGDREGQEAKEAKEGQPTAERLELRHLFTPHLGVAESGRVRMFSCNNDWWPMRRPESCLSHWQKLGLHKCQAGGVLKVLLVFYL